jgi:glycerate 2-kinase
MRIVCAPDSLKESLSAANAANAMRDGLEDAARALGVAIDIDCCPIADGGEGTVETLVAATDGALHRATVTGPLGHPIEAHWGMLGDGETAVVGVDQACGLQLVPPDQRNPEKTTTYGVGELIAAALDAGCKRLIVGLGGSGTTDGGAGLASALGARFQGAPRKVTGGDLAAIESVDLTSLDPRLAHLEIRIACDVNNPLTGPRGSAATYGPQKGATPEQVERLDAGLAHLAKLSAADPDTPGFGSAGGLGFGLATFLGGKLQPGAPMILEVVRFRERCRDADLVLTGEGRLDEQTLSGKATQAVAELARSEGVPTIALVGAVGTGIERCTDPTAGGPFTAWRSIVDGPMTLDEAKANAALLMRRAAEQTLRHWLAALS